MYKMSMEKALSIQEEVLNFIGGYKPNPPLTHTILILGELGYIKHQTNKCPECKCVEVINKNFVGEGYRECEKCGQEWWIDIKY